MKLLIETIRSSKKLENVCACSSVSFPFPSVFYSWIVSVIHARLSLIAFFHIFFRSSISCLIPVWAVVVSILSLRSFTSRPLRFSLADIENRAGKRGIRYWVGRMQSTNLYHRLRKYTKQIFDPLLRHLPRWTKWPYESIFGVFHQNVRQGLGWSLRSIWTSQGTLFWQ